jgi:hypothetical protein
MPPGSILRIIKPLYGIPEAGNHWFNTYYNHHTKKLGLEPSTFDPCFLFRNDSNGFGLIGMQTDDTLIVADSVFASTEEAGLKEANLVAKKRDKLTENSPIKFNRGQVTLNTDRISLT